MKNATAGRRRKYNPDLLTAMFRKAAALRNDMLAAGFTDNGGAIHSAERILNLLGIQLNYPDLTHINKLRESRHAIFSVEALRLHQAGGQILIEHVSPLRHLTQCAIEQIDRQVSDDDLKNFIRQRYQLVLLSPDETLRLNKHNRSKMHPDRLKQVNIELVITTPA